MRAKFLMFGALVLPLVSGCTNASSEPESTNAVPSPAVESPSLAEAPVASALPQANVPPGKVVSTNLTLPATVQLSPAATEVAKMARAGVDASVMLSYVGNSVNTYHLSADEIVYLNDLGVRPEVVSAMIQHDQQIREASLNGAMAASPATPAPGASVWNAGQVTAASNVWQETAAAPAPAAEVQTTVPPPPAEERPAEVTVNYFYDSLSPYGTWIDIEGYGRCWRPTVVATYPDWRPYVHGGRWLWTDAGWYWYSDYSWGWAPFHYGRWFSHPSWGWCWTPGTVWGPSWVSWRYTDGYCGWAPLPPAAYYAPSIGFTYYGRSCGTGFSFGLTWDYFTFVSYNNFCGRSYDRHRVGRHETAQIYNNSTVINNVIVGDNNTIINQGIGTDRIRAATRSEIPRANVQALAANTQTIGGRHEALAADGSAVLVTRHQVPGGRPSRSGTAQAMTAPADSVNTPVVNATHSSGPRSETARTGNQDSPNRHGAAIGGTRSDLAGAAASVVNAGVAASAASTSIAPEATPPSRNDDPRSGGALIIREGQVTTTPSSATAPSASAAAAPSRATPWLNNSSSANTAVTRAPNAPWQSTVRSSSPAGTAPTRPVRPDNSTFVRSQPNNTVPATPAPTVSSAPEPQTPRVVTAPPSVQTPAQSPVVRAPNSPWRPPTRTETVNSTPTRSVINSAPPARSSVPTYSAPVVTQPAPAPVAPPRVSQPAPTPRIERSSPPRALGAPAPPQPTRSYTPAMRDTVSRIESISRAQSAPAPAPVPRSAAPSGGNNNSSGGSGPSRPSR